MPYRWTDTAETRTLRLWPYRSLPRRGFAGFILITFGLIILPLFPILGTVVVWGLLPFMLLAVAGIWWALQRNYRDGEVSETLTLTAQNIRLCRNNPRGDTQTWQANPYWARADLHESGGPVPWYVTLTGGQRTVEIGAFLSEDERRRLYGEIASALREMTR